MAAVSEPQPAAAIPASIVGPTTVAPPTPPSPPSPAPMVATTTTTMPPPALLHDGETDDAHTTPSAVNSASLDSAEDSGDCDMKNTARKSTTKPPMINVIMPSVNGDVSPTTNKMAAGDVVTPVANGNGTTTTSLPHPPLKRGSSDNSNNDQVASSPVDGSDAGDGEDGPNPAKVARLKIQDLEKAQEEMTRKVSRAETTDDNSDEVTMTSSPSEIPAQNGKDVTVLSAPKNDDVTTTLSASTNDITDKEAAAEDSLSRHSTQSQQGDKSNDSSNSKHSSATPGSGGGARSSLTLSADARSTFKGMFDVAMAKVGEEKKSTSSVNGTQHSSKDSDSDNDTASAAVEIIDDNDDQANDASTDTPQRTTSEAEKTSEDKPVDISSDSDGLSDTDGVTPVNDKSKADYINNKSSNVTNDDVAGGDDVLLGDAGMDDHGGDVDDAVLLSDDDINADSKDKQTDKLADAKNKEANYEPNSPSSSTKVTTEPASKESCSSPSIPPPTTTPTTDFTKTSHSSALSPQPDNAESYTDRDKDTKGCQEKPNKEADKDKDKQVEDQDKEVITDPIEKGDENESEGKDGAEEGEKEGRKRSAESPVPTDSANNSSKKSRLDAVIGRLGSAVSKMPSDIDDETSNEKTEEKMDTEEGDDKENKDLVVKVDIDAETGDGVKKRADESVEGSLKNADIKTEIKPTVTVEAGRQTFTLTAEELNKLLMKKVNALLGRAKGSQIAQLETRISELQMAVESWRAQAKRLAKQLDEEVAKSAARRHGKIGKRGGNNSNRASVDNSSAVQQQGNNTKVAIRPATRTPPRPSPHGMPANPNNTTSIRLSPAQSAALKGTTVRDLLDIQRGTDGNAPKGPQQSVQIQGGRILVAGSPVMPATRPGTTSATLVRAAPPAAPTTPGSKVIDLTDDDDRKSADGGKVVRGQQVAVRAATAPGGTGARGQLVAIPSSGQVVLQPVVPSQPLRAGGTTIVYTSTRPGTVGLQTSPGTSLVRPGTTLVTTSTPPALRPAGAQQQVVALTRAPAPAAAAARPPPPLRSAPATSTNSSSSSTQVKHPAPLPPIPLNQSSQAKDPPPKPSLKISRVQTGIVLSWNMAISDTEANIASYQLFAYQETSAPPSTSLWKKVGDVKALPLPMACTLTQFQEGNKYHFAVRAVDVHKRVGPFSDPSSIALTVINIS